MSIKKEPTKEILEEETLFKDLYRKTLDLVEYVSDEERRWVEAHKSK